MRYEESAHIIGEDSEKLRRLLNEYETIRMNLEKELSMSGRSDLYTDLNNEIGKIIDSAEACRELYKEYGL